MNLVALTVTAVLRSPQLILQVNSPVAYRSSHGSVMRG